MKPIQIASYLLVLALGMLLGGYLFKDVQTRSFMAVKPCNGCYRPNELAGLLASAGVLRAGAALPLVVMETERCLAIRHPAPWAQSHYVIFPKKDIKDIGDIAIDDQPYVLDCLAMSRKLAQEKGFRHYRFYTNGPGLQDVRYLHFHLIMAAPDPAPAPRKD
ncbi:HIT domain-containing protein [Chitinimonas arctica]|uniref:HIT domain-containing protein n=1 Tax=Chitinimonas arctica TaxID=2594795 RepID=A0A516SED5_9NEIS|nr:HIT domain-containing protein [Chitinimonas arctica]QDQ26524.1 HIT domain-containing protein [Chitinimonas arctica]